MRLKDDRSAIEAFTDFGRRTWPFFLGFFVVVLLALALDFEPKSIRPFGIALYIVAFLCLWVSLLVYVTVNVVARVNNALRRRKQPPSPERGSKSSV